MLKENTHHAVWVVPDPEPREAAGGLGEGSFDTLLKYRDDIAMERSLVVERRTVDFLDVQLMTRGARRGLGTRRVGHGSESGLGHCVEWLRHG